MLVTMQRATFDSLDHAGLARACIEPTIQQIRGKNLNVKSQVYTQLTAGQRALLMFWVLYGHAQGGVAQFYREVDYLLVRMDIWSELKVGISYFGDEAMLRLVEEMERVYRVLVATNRLAVSEWLSVGADSFGGDPELLLAARGLDTLFREIAPGTLSRVGAYIREHPDEFVRIED